jgi:glycosyltransferase involved in cell wall biosynthesis
MDPDVPHLSYVHTPMRYCWGFEDSYLASVPVWARRMLAWRFERLREWDRTTPDNVDHFVANSHNVADRVRKYYGRVASVCTPPISPSLLAPEYPKYRAEHSRREHYLSFGALTPYKNIELLLEAFRALPERMLWIVGEGPDRTRLEALAGPNVRFLGGVPWENLHRLILSARALLVPGEEDFGMVPPEVMAHGTPVIAYGRGGVLETVVDGEADPSQGTGLFFDEPTVESLLDAIRRFESLEDDFDPYHIQDHARRFSEENFLASFEEEVWQVLREGRR